MRSRTPRVAPTAYWDAIELLDDVQLAFGRMSGLRKKARQKGVVIQLAVDLVAGAADGIFDVAVLVTGDSDFVPAVEEVRRRGVMFAAAASDRSIASMLCRAEDRSMDLADYAEHALRPLMIEGQSWPAPSAKSASS